VDNKDNFVSFYKIDTMRRYFVVFAFLCLTFCCMLVVACSQNVNYTKLKSIFVDTVVVDDSRISMPDILGTDTNGNSIVVDRSDFFYYSDFVFYYQGELIVKDNAPSVFDSTMEIVYKHDQSIKTIVDLHKPFVATTSIKLSTLGDNTNLSIGVYKDIKASVLPTNATNKQIVYSILPDQNGVTSATVDNYGRVVPNIDAQVGSTVLVQASQTNCNTGVDNHCSNQSHQDDCTVSTTIVLTITNPQSISNITNLKSIRGDIYGDYILQNDIDLLGGEWNPIPQFFGTINGNGFVISNFCIYNYNSTNTSLGFFQTNYGDIFDINFATIKILMSPQNQITQVMSFGIIAGLNYGNISSVDATDIYININSWRGVIGALIGRNYGTLYNVSLSGSIVVWVATVGGVVGYNYG